MHTLETIHARIAGCEGCALCRTRTHTVPGEGAPKPTILFVGEAPGAQEDATGRPFVGAAGQLLDRILEAIALDRTKVYIANVLKCRPPNNRDPAPEEIQACLPYLRAQYAALRPKILVSLGRISAQTLIRPTLSIMREHGQWSYRKGLWMMATYHPSALLRNAALKRDAWQDFQSVRDKLKEILQKESEEGENRDEQGEQTGETPGRI